MNLESKLQASISTAQAIIIVNDQIELDILMGNQLNRNADTTFLNNHSNSGDVGGHDIEYDHQQDAFYNWVMNYFFVTSVK